MPSKVTLEVTLNTRAEAKEDILPPSQPSHLSRGRGIGSTPNPPADSALRPKAGALPTAGSTPRPVAPVSLKSPSDPAALRPTNVTPNPVPLAPIQLLAAADTRP